MTVLAFPFYPEEKDAKASKVLVTGACGMIGGGCIQRLLACGHTVCAIDIDLSNDKAVLPLKNLPGASERLKLIQGDITDPNCIKNAMKDCAVEYIIHTASPVMEPSDPSKAESELIEPALKGACNVLEAANSCDSVQRVVMTSSTSAIYNDKKGPGAEFTEDDWAEGTSPEKAAYSHSKMVVEKKAWEMEKAQNRWKLVVINPVHCFGPQIDERLHAGWSVDIFVALYKGEFEKEPNKDISVVDVRDVAAAHTLAMVHPHAHGRNICSEGAYTARHLAEYLHEKCAECKVPPASKEHPPKLTHFNNSKIQKELGLKFHSAKQAVQDMYMRLKEVNCLPSK